MDAITRIDRTQKEISVLQGIIELLEWDEETMMSHDAVLGRSDQIALLEGLVHKRFNSPELKGALRSVRQHDLLPHERIVLRVLRREVERRSRIPTDLVERLAEESVTATHLWKQARKDKDFKVFLPSLKKLIALRQRYARRLDDTKSPFIVLVQENEPDLSEQRIVHLMKVLRRGLSDLLSRVRSSPSYSKDLSHIKLDKKLYNAFLSQVLSDIGVPSRRTHISSSMHPFTSLVSRNDVRITSRSTTRIERFFDIIHEAGHALYDLGLPQQYYHTLVYQGASLGLHESQSTFWEHFVGKNEHFWRHYYSSLSPAFLEPVSFDDFSLSINRVAPGAIRMDADELTYGLHIIIRYDIERGLIEGTIDPKDASRLWNVKMKEYLGVDVRHDAEGILQDIHWADGDFGYFPTYLIGLVYASQIYHHLKTELPGFSRGIRQGRFVEMLAWLRENIHRKGRSMSAEQVMRAACGKGLDPQVFLDYLEDKYSGIYRLTGKAASH
ncbi:MAG: carboxypeptidase M32 [archaeon]